MTKPNWTNSKAVAKFVKEWLAEQERQDVMEDAQRDHPDIPWRELLAGIAKKHEDDVIYLARRGNFTRLANLFMEGVDLSPVAKKLIVEKLTNKFKGKQGKPPQRTPEERRDTSWLPDAEVLCEDVAWFLSKYYYPDQTKQDINDRALVFAAKEYKQHGNHGSQII